MIAKIENDWRWPIEPSHRQIVVEELMKIVSGSNTAQSIRACRVLMELDAQNMLWEKVENESLRAQIRQVLANRMAANGADDCDD